MLNSTSAIGLRREDVPPGNDLHAWQAGSHAARRYYNVAIHDVTVSTLRQVTAITNFLLGLDVTTISYLVIPRYHDQENIVLAKHRLSDVAAGQELVLHGLTHQGAKNSRFSYLRLLTDGEAECLSCPDLQARVSHGLRLLADAGLAAVGFIPPAWLIDTWQIPVMRACGLMFMNTRWHVHDLVNARRYFAPVLTFSSRGGLEALSLYTFALMFRLIRHCAMIRVAIHPQDLANPLKVHILQNTIRRLAQRREAVSFAEFVQRKVFREDL